MRTVLLVAILLASEQTLAQVPESESVPGSSPQVENQGSQQTERRTDTAEGFSVPVRIIEDEDAAARRERRETDADTHEQKDLEAQQSMARSTVELVEVSWAQFVLAALGTTGLIVSLMFTARATRAATAALELTRDFSRRELRAYLSIKEIGVLQNGPGRITGALRMINTGQTPADVIGFRAKLEIGKPWDKSVPAPGNKIDAAMSIGSGRDNIFSAQESLAFGNAEADALLTEGISLRLHGMVQYRDVFGAEHETHFAHRICGQGSVFGNSMNIDHAGRNDAT